MDIFNQCDAFSVDEEEWSQDIDVVYDYCKEYLEAGDDFIFWGGISEKLTHLSVIGKHPLDTLIDQMQDSLFDEIGDTADGYLYSIRTNANNREFAEYIAKFIQSKAGDCGYFKVKDTVRFNAVWDGEEFTLKLSRKG